MTPAAYEPLEISLIDIKAESFRDRAQRCREEASRLLQVAVRFEIMASAIDEHTDAGIDDLVHAVLGGDQ